VLSTEFMKTRRRRMSAWASEADVLLNDIDLLNPPAELEKRTHKLKRLVQFPNSFFMDAKLSKANQELFYMMSPPYFQVSLKLRQCDHLRAMHLREPGSSPQKWARTQVAAGTRVAFYHDEIKLSLPAIWTPSHHLLFTFFHVDLQTKLEAPKP
ncbi:unnamed protein product, partial [Dovyalis caffra]